MKLNIYSLLRYTEINKGKIMAFEMNVVSVEQKIKAVSIASGGQLTVKPGDRIQLTLKADIKTFRKGNDLILKSAKGEGAVLKDFYLKSPDGKTKQLLSWDDELNQKKELYSEYQETKEGTQIVAQSDIVSTDNMVAVADTTKTTGTTATEVGSAGGGAWGHGGMGVK